MRGWQEGVRGWGWWWWVVGRRWGRERSRLEEGRGGVAE